MAPILEIEAEQGFRSFIDKDEVARRIDHEGRNRQAMGQLANQDQFNGQLGHNYTPRRLKTSTEWLIEGNEATLSRMGSGSQVDSLRHSRVKVLPGWIVMSS